MHCNGFPLRQIAFTINTHLNSSEFVRLLKTDLSQDLPGCAGQREGGGLTDGAGGENITLYTRRQVQVDS